MDKPAAAPPNPMNPTAAGSPATGQPGDRGDWQLRRCGPLPPRSAWTADYAIDTGGALPARWFSHSGRDIGRHRNRSQSHANPNHSNQAREPRWPARIWL